MNKAQLSEAIALRTGLTKADARKAVDALVSIAAQTFREDGKITLSGLGSFTVQHRSARLGRNPRTGAPVRIPPHRSVTFRPTVDLD